MRIARGLTTVIMAFAIVQFPVAIAAEETADAAPRARILDPAGDPVQVSPTGSQNDNGEHPQADILEAWIGNETLEAVEFGIRFKQVQDPNSTANLVPLSSLASLSTTPGYTIYWTLGLVNFTIQGGGEITNCGGSSTSFRRVHPRGSSTSCGAFDPGIDEAGQSLTFIIPRERLLNETDAPFGPGTDITNFYATASEPITPGPAGTIVRDRAPDEGYGPSYHSALAGEESGGGLTMTATQPIRVSNGESTTLVYSVDITNHEDTTRIVHLSVKNDMPDWQIRVPARLQIAGKETIRFPVILSMGFSHDHGGLTTFDVRAEDAADSASFAKVRLGVFWLDTPQPAGHHDTMWLHSGGGGSYSSGGLTNCQTANAWFNPLEKELEGRATEVDVAGCDFTLSSAFTGGTPYSQGQAFEWRVPLDPVLAIGLDFDPERTGKMSFGLKTKVGAPSADMKMELLFCDTEQESDGRRISFESCTGKWVVLASASETRTLPNNGLTQFELEFTPTPEADFLPYTRDSNLLLFLTLTSEQPLTPPGQTRPEYAPLLVVQGSTLVLPLIEYHDPIDQAFQNVGTIELEAQDAFEKPINPGRRSLFRFDLTNRGTLPQEVELQIEGHNREWARILGPATLRLEPTATTNFTIVSQAPVDANPGERAELFVVTQSHTDPNVVAIARLRSTLVDPAIQDVPDEDPSTLEQTVEGVPGVGIVAAGLVMLIAWSRRRRTP